MIFVEWTLCWQYLSQWGKYGIKIFRKNRPMIVFYAFVHTAYGFELTGSFRHAALLLVHTLDYLHRRITVVRVRLVHRQVLYHSAEADWRRNCSLVVRLCVMPTIIWTTICKSSVRCSLLLLRLASVDTDKVAVETFV